MLLSRRNLLKAGLAGLAGLSLPGLLRHRAAAGRNPSNRKSVILLWMAGGPSHIDTWDPKPDRPPITVAPLAPSPPECPACVSASTCRNRRRCWTASP